MWSVVIVSKWHADWWCSSQIVKGLDENKDNTRQGLPYFVWTHKLQMKDLLVKVHNM
jgi:hypothetical protein